MDGLLLRVVSNVGSVPKHEVEWTDSEDKASIGNSHALNDIFNCVDRNIFRLINTCVSIKEA